MKFDLIPASEAERMFFRKVHHVAYRSVIEAMFGWDEASQDKTADREFDERNPHLIVEADNAVGIIGWLSKEDHIWFGPLYVLPEFQGKGIGSSVVKHFIKQAEERNLPLRLRTLRKNEGAKRLYERHGFKVTSASDIHWHMEFCVAH